MHSLRVCTEQSCDYRSASKGAACCRRQREALFARKIWPVPAASGADARLSEVLLLC